MWSRKNIPQKAPNCISITGKKGFEKFNEVCSFINEKIDAISNMQRSGHTLDVPDQIKKLADLKEQGIITELEFEEKKKDLLARI